MHIRDVKISSIRFSPAMIQTLKKKKVETSEYRVSKYLNDDISQHRADDLDKFTGTYRRKPTDILPVTLTAYYMRYDEELGPIYEYEIADGRHRITSAAIVKRKTVKAVVANLPELCIKLYHQGVHKPLLWHIDKHQMEHQFLDESVSRGSTLCAKIALEKGVNPNDLDLFTYLVHNTVDPDMVELLLKYGANFNVKDIEGNNPVIYTFKTCDSFEYLSDYHKKRIMNNTKYLCGKFYSINDTNNEGNTALMELCGKHFNDLEAVEFIVNFGNMGALTHVKNEKGLTAATYIDMKQTSYKRKEIIQYLMKPKKVSDFFSFVI